MKIDEKEYKKLVREGVLTRKGFRTEPPKVKKDPVAEALELVARAVKDNGGGQDIAQVVEYLIEAQKENAGNLRKVLENIAGRKTFWQKIRFDVKHYPNGRISHVDAEVLE